MMHMWLIRIICLAILVSGCEKAPKLELVAPEDFAVYQSKRGGNDVLFHSVSYSGVTYRVRYEKNKHRADLKFWQEALARHLHDSGYVLVGERAIDAANRHGHLLDFVAPTKKADFRFSVGLFLHEDNIIITEAAGEMAEYKKFEGVIAAAIKKMRFIARKV